MTTKQEVFSSPLKYQKVAEQLRRDMEAGHIKPGDRLPSIAEMRAKFGISRPTMDKAHSILEHEGLISRQPGAGTFVLQPAKPRVNGVIAVGSSGYSCPEDSPYWGTLLAGVRAGAARAGLQVQLFDYETRHWPGADGLLICGWEPEDALRHIPANLPCVSLLTPVLGMTSVYADDYSGARKATEHLLSLGHRRIGYLHNLDVSTISRRLSGYRDALEAAGARQTFCCERLLTGARGDNGQFIEAGRRVVRQWLKDDWEQQHCTALLAQNDYVAIGVIEALREAGVRVPDDVSVVGFDGLQIGQIIAPRLTTVAVPLREIGNRAVQLLRQSIESGHSGAEHCMLPACLQIGESCALFNKSQALLTAEEEGLSSRTERNEGMRSGSKP